MPELFNTVMHTASWQLQEFVPVESKMVCVLAMSCKLIQLFMVVSVGIVAFPFR
ncbi:hypothetical protein HU200_006213 [Digitaria exilis]|uniref:Uncharacterized protein n=1 Tax=Digitaria exilis TaxID=1010633 RepID=A0A835B8U9_9POAL|nr:hypothetical protein HU200_040533 [Digitaria exilis]KAF8769619.1 hypothetical protein HU200_006213 [Digitaria exilis]